MKAYDKRSCSNIEDLAPAWRELESQTHVKLRAIGSERTLQGNGVPYEYLSTELAIVKNPCSHGFTGCRKRLRE